MLTTVLAPNEKQIDSNRTEKMTRNLNVTLRENEIFQHHRTEPLSIWSYVLPIICSIGCAGGVFGILGGPLGLLFGSVIAATVAASVTPVIVVIMRLLNGTTVAPVPALLIGATSRFASGFIAVWLLGIDGQGSFQLEPAAFAAVVGALGGCLGANRHSKAAHPR